MQTFDTFRKIHGTYTTTKFWVIATLISGGSALCLSKFVADMPESGQFIDIALSLLFIVIATFGILVLPFALWQHIAKNRFFDWLASQWTNLENGALHPDGYTVTLDTRLVCYQAVFSAVFATVSFESRPYVYEHRSAGAAQISFSVVSGLFGWWFLGPEGVVETAKALYGNARSKRIYTLRDLSSGTFET